MGSVFQLKFKDYKIGEETDSSRCCLKKSCLKYKDNERLKVMGSRKVHFEKQKIFTYLNIYRLNGRRYFWR